MVSKIAKLISKIVISLILIFLLSVAFFGFFPTIFVLAGVAGYIDIATDKMFGPDLKKIDIDGQKFSVPEEIVSIATRAPEPYTNSASFHLEYIWPDIKPLRMSIKEHSAAQSEMRFSYLHVTKAFPDKVKAEMTLEKNKDGTFKNEYIGKYEDYEVYRYYYYIKLDSKDEIGSQHKSYIKKDLNGNITEHLNCYGPSINEKLYPYSKDEVYGCTYSFIDKGLLYNFRGRGPEDKDLWQEWKNKNIAFIDQFREENSK